MMRRTWVFFFLASVTKISLASQVTVWWKPKEVSSIARDVEGMKSQLFATNVIIYCGYAALHDGSFGVDPHPEGNWGNVSLCKHAVQEASSSGLGVQIIVEGRLDGNVLAAMRAGGAQFGAQAKKVIASTYPLVHGLNIDWEVGHTKPSSMPTQAQMDNFTSAFAASVAPLHVTVCLAQWTQYVANFSSVISNGHASAIFDMGMYHGISTAEWTGKLTDALSNVGNQYRSLLAVGYALYTKYAWENTTASVIDRFAAMKSAGIEHVALFAWQQEWASKLPEGVAAELTAQLREFTHPSQWRKESITVIADLSIPTYPPLVSKWGGVEHWDTVSANDTQTMAANFRRNTPMVLGVVQMGTTMSNDTAPYFARAQPHGPVTVILNASRQALRRQRGGPNGVRTLLQFDGCPTINNVFAINKSSVPSRSARYYPMCEYDQLDELAEAFANYSQELHAREGLPMAWSFWPEPMHTIQDDKVASKHDNFERYLDFYTLASLAMRKANRDDKVAGWQLNAANGNGKNAAETGYMRACQMNFARESREKTRYPMDFFTIQNYQGDESATLVENARAALVNCSGKRDSARYALTPVVFVRFSEEKTVDPNYKLKSGVTALLNQLKLTADIPDVAYVLAGNWEKIISGTHNKHVSPMVTAALRFWRNLPAFRGSFSVTGQDENSVRTSIQGVSAMGGNSIVNRQCFMLWSPKSNPVTIANFSFVLRWAALEASKLEVLTLGPKKSDFFPLKTVEVASGTEVIHAGSLSLVANGVAAGCLGTAQTSRDDGAAPPFGVFARDDVLVPRGAIDSVRPAGMGHFDSFSSTLFVATEPPAAHSKGTAIGIAGAILRNFSMDAGHSVCLDLQLQATVADVALADIVVRFDFLDGDNVMQSISMSNRQNMNLSAFWNTGLANVWPKGTDNVGSAAKYFIFDEEGQARVCFSNMENIVGFISDLEWAHSDGGARRVRITLAMKAGEAASNAAAISAKIIGDDPAR